MSLQPYLTLRVVPAALGAHAAITGSFTLMEFAEFKPVAYLDSETSSLFRERPEEIAAYQSILSSYSYIGGTCVEVAPGPDTVLIRDSKNRTGPALTVPTTTWRVFLTTSPTEPVARQRTRSQGRRPESQLVGVRLHAHEQVLSRERGRVR